MMSKPSISQLILKFDQPGHWQRSAKFSGSKNEDKPHFKKPGLPAPTTRPPAPSITYSSRLNSNANSRLRLQKQVNGARPGSSKPTTTLPQRSSTKQPDVKIKNKRPPLDETNAKKLLQANGNRAIALATLLDYVVNKLDGLSAPKLSNRNSQLEHLLLEKSRDYENALRESQENHEQTLAAEIERNRKLIDELTRTHEDKLQDLQKSHEEEIVALQQETDEKIQEYEQEIEQKCQEQVQKLIEPYINAHAEVESLQTVLEMKNKQLHEMQTNACERTLQDNQIRSLQDKIESLEYKNEDLVTQLKEKNNDYNLMQQKCTDLRQSVDDEHNRSRTLNQQNEQLLYRLNSVSPSSTSFNPVFTTSPALNSNKINQFFVSTDQFHGDSNHCQNDANTSI